MKDSAPSVFQSLCSPDSQPQLKLRAVQCSEYTVRLFGEFKNPYYQLSQRKHNLAFRSSCSHKLFLPRAYAHVHVYEWGQKEGSEPCLGVERTKNKHQPNRLQKKNTKKIPRTKLMVAPFLFNTEQYYSYSCNMSSRAEVRNITDRLQGVKIPLLRMAS